MDQELHHGHPVIRRIYLYLFILTLLLLFGFVVLYFSQVQPTSQSGQQTTEELTQKPALKTEDKGFLTMSVQNNDLAEVRLGQTFNLSVAASSEDSQIVGFDVVVSYDKTAFTMGKASTPLQSFQVFPNEHEDYVIFTGALNVNGEAVTFAETPILTIPFTAKLKGKYTFSVLPNSGNELTKLVEAQTTKVFAPEVAALQVTVN